MTSKHRSITSDRAEAARRSLASMRSGGPPLDLDSLTEEIRAEREIVHAPNLSPMASIRERTAAEHATLTRALRPLIRRYGHDGSTDAERIQDFANTLRDEPELVQRDLEEIAPGAVARWENLAAETESRRRDLGVRLAKNLGPFVSNVPPEGESSQALLEALERSVVDGYTQDQAAGAVVRSLIDAGRADDLLDGAATARDEDELFRLAATAPEPPRVDPFAGMSDRDLEKALQGSVAEQDAELAPGIFLENVAQHSKHAKHAKREFAAFKAEVEQMEKDAPPTPHRSQYDELFR